MNWPSPVLGWFQNGSNKVVIEPCAMQFWSEIILVISNQTHTMCSFDFEITCMISAQIALHSVQLPLFNIQKNVQKNIGTLISLKCFVPGWYKKDEVCS